MMIDCLAKPLSRAAVLLCSLLLTSEGQAASVAGHITMTFYSGPANYAFRIVLDTTPSGCAGGFLYINAADGNYDAYVAGLMSAYYTGKPAIINYALDSNSFCHISEFGT